ncbi:MAG TPA: T9SS type A sorting domain-containing protein [Puia sp.]|nr:T9SS type A sorting domain-containing protein [Puia sp.]
MNLFAGLLVINLSMAAIHPACAYASNTPVHTLSKGNPDTGTIHSIQVNKSLVSKKNKIRLFPDARQQVLFFSVLGEDKKVYQLYLFDMDGRLVSQASIRNRETTVLTTLSEGNYLFEIFTDDERIENGHLIVR